MRLILILLFLLSSNNLWAQTFEADLSIAVTSDAFSDGISPGESGLFNLSVTNLGPDSYSIESEFDFTYSYRGAEGQFIVGEFFDNDPVSSNCEFIFSNASPRPPDENGFFFPTHWFKLTTSLSVGQTATCQIRLTFAQSGYLETRWRLRTGTDSQTENNEAFFVFRGTPQSVPLNIKLFLIAGFLIMFLMHFKKNKGK